MEWQHVRLPGSPSQVPIVIDFSSRYPDGRRADEAIAWAGRFAVDDEPMVANAIGVRHLTRGEDAECLRWFIRARSAARGR